MGGNGPRLQHTLGMLWDKPCEIALWKNSDNYYHMPYYAIYRILQICFLLERINLVTLLAAEHLCTSILACRFGFGFMKQEQIRCSRAPGKNLFSVGWCWSNGWYCVACWCCWRSWWMLVVDVNGRNRWQCYRCRHLVADSSAAVASVILWAISCSVSVGVVAPVDFTTCDDTHFSLLNTRDTPRPRCAFTRRMFLCVGHIYVEAPSRATKTSAPFVFVD